LTVPLHDAGFVWGATITDLCRTVRHQLYRWEQHLDRFRRSCRAALIFPALPEEDLVRQARELVAHNVQFLAPHQDLALVMLATPGPISSYAGDERSTGKDEPNFLMHTFPLPAARYRPWFQRGAHLVIPPTIRQLPPECIDPRIKQRSRLHWWLAEQEARRLDARASALLLDLDGHITETAAANFLLVQNGAVLSPPRGTILEGVSLQVVRDLCSQLGIPTREQPLNLYDCRNADEAMLTGTSFCLAGVSQLNHGQLPWPGPVYRRLLAAWSDEIGVDIAGQYLEW
jgi:branched-subunit amino acid aminotransferase/4-amino-4-deoxychorismate lyase